MFLFATFLKIFRDIDKRIKDYEMKLQEKIEEIEK
jgi:hypothetical protein